MARRHAGRGVLSTAARFARRYFVPGSTAERYPESMDINGKLLFGYGANGDHYET